MAKLKTYYTNLKNMGIIDTMKKDKQLEKMARKHINNPTKLFNILKKKYNEDVLDGGSKFLV